VELQRAVRFALFHTLQAGARGERRPIPAKGLTGPGYDGHTFWDTEAFVLPLLTYTRPRSVSDALRWRHQTLDLARERARALGLRGAAFPWRTIAGEECSGYWPAGTAAFHINAAIANAVERYQTVTEDETFEREAGVELLVETARLWRSLGRHDSAGRFRIDGVTGPDEDSAIAENNVYTNPMAARNLRAAADAAARHPDVAEHLGVDDEEAASWRDAAQTILIPYDEPLQVMALFFAGEAFTAEEKARDFAYYEQLTVRDSSLSACIQAIVAAEVGHVELAYDYFAEAALLDLDDREHNTRDGVHIASLAGACIIALAAFGGLRDHGGMLAFTPRLPPALTRIAFSLRVPKNTQLRIDNEPTQSTYTLLTGEPIDIHHHGQPLRVTTDHPTRCATPPTPTLERPTQPPGREPKRRRAPAERTNGSPAAPARPTAPAPRKPARRRSNRRRGRPKPPPEPGP